jgi:hypothetical protein
LFSHFKKSYGDNPENPVIIGEKVGISVSGCELAVVIEENVGISASGCTLVVKEFACNAVVCACVPGVTAALSRHVSKAVSVLALVTSALKPVRGSVSSQTVKMLLVVDPLNCPAAVSSAAILFPAANTAKSAHFRH